MSRYAITSALFFILFIGSLSVDGVWNIPVSWYISLLIIFILINIYGSAVISAQFFVAAKVRATQPTKSIALTFDDGPITGKTEKILDILKSQQVQAAFFCIGHRVKDNPALVKRIHEEGHIVGNHSYTHKNTFDLLSTASVTKELAATNSIIHSTIDLQPKFFRPPYGVTNPMIARAVKRKNVTVIGWSVRSFDTVIKDKDKLLSRVSKQMKDGDIILFHDHCDATIDILSAVIDQASKLGLKIVRVDKLLNEKAYA